MFSCSSLLLSSLELSDTHVFEPAIRARLGTAAHFCEVALPKWRQRDARRICRTGMARRAHTCIRPVGETLITAGNIFIYTVDTPRGAPREQKMLKGHLPRVIYRQVYFCRTGMARRAHTCIRPVGETLINTGNTFMHTVRPSDISLVMQVAHQPFLRET